LIETDRRTAATEEEAWLLGQPPLSDYVEFVRHVAVGGDVAPMAPFVDEWRAAGEHYQQLEEREAGLANEVECLDIEPSLAPLVEEVARAPRFVRAFGTLPTRFGMVQLDRLIVSQKSVTWSFVEELQARLGGAPDPEAVFRFCHPLERDDSPVEIRRVGSRRWAFRSRSRDLRFHEATLLSEGDLRAPATIGPVAGTVGIAVGFGSNFLNVIRVGRRLLLHNGTHRACALRALGLTHAPAIIQTVTSTDELELAAKSSVAARADFYFRSARPPLLKDFFDPRIARRIRARRQLRQIEVQFEVKEYLVDE
jgi:hypothetical protein